MSTRQLNRVERLLTIVAVENFSLHSLFQHLAAERRRHVVDFSRDDEDGTVSLDALVDHSIEREARSPASTGDAIVGDPYHVRIPTSVSDTTVGGDRGEDGLGQRTRR